MSSVFDPGFLEGRPPCRPQKFWLLILGFLEGRPPCRPRRVGAGLGPSGRLKQNSSPRARLLDDSMNSSARLANVLEISLRFSCRRHGRAGPSRPRSKDVNSRRRKDRGAFAGIKKPPVHIRVYWTYNLRGFSYFLETRPLRSLRLGEIRSIPASVFWRAGAGPPLALEQNVHCSKGDDRRRTARGPR